MICIRSDISWMLDHYSSHCVPTAQYNMRQKPVHRDNAGLSLLNDNAQECTRKHKQTSTYKQTSTHTHKSIIPTRPAEDNRYKGVEIISGPVIGKELHTYKWWRLLKPAKAPLVISWILLYAKFLRKRNRRINICWSNSRRKKLKSGSTRSVCLGSTRFG